MNEALAVFRFLQKCAERGERAVLVTLVDVIGSSARAPGAHMAVSESGKAVGSFSGGCVEAAVVTEARQVLDGGYARWVVYGAGSPYLDIRLPCGGGINLLFVPQPPVAAVRAVCAGLEQRRAVTLGLTPEGQLSARPAHAGDRTGWQESLFLVRHDPVLRLLILGHGAEPGALLRLAKGYGAEAMLISPDPASLAEAERLGFPAARLPRMGPSEYLAADPWTAVVTLFHDHDWETDLLIQALEQRSLLVGSMGSRRTHAERCRRLIEAGAAPQDIARLVGPIGRIKATRDPRTLAVSILAQVVEAYEAAVAGDEPLQAEAEAGPASLHERASVLLETRRVTERAAPAFV